MYIHKITQIIVYSMMNFHKVKYLYNSDKKFEQYQHPRDFLHALSYYYPLKVLFCL